MAWTTVLLKMYFLVFSFVCLSSMRFCYLFAVRSAHGPNCSCQLKAELITGQFLRDIHVLYPGGGVNSG